jgi:signal transduction histidine kinase
MGPDPDTAGAGVLDPPKGGPDDRPSARVLPALTRLVLDWTPPVALAAIVGHELVYDHAGPWEWLLSQALVWPLAVRRRAPVAVLAWTLALAGAQWAFHQLSTDYLAVLFALYAVAARRSRRTAIVAATLVEAGTLLVATRFSPAGSVNDGILLLTALVLAFALLGTAQRTQQQYLSVLEERADQLARERDQQALIAAAQERQRIAREMHDIVAHSVSVMIALSEGAAAKAEKNPPQAKESMRQVAATGRDALTELRKVLSVLRDPGSGDRRPQPTVASLDFLAEDMNTAGLPVTLTVTGDANALPDAVQVTIFRVVQEALTNVLKHAHEPTRAEVRVEASPRTVVVTVQDDGRAVSRATPPPRGSGNGLAGMRERARLFEGSVAAGRHQDQGWVLTCTLHPTSEGTIDTTTPGR